MKRIKPDTFAPGSFILSHVCLPLFLFSLSFRLSLTSLYFSALKKKNKFNCSNWSDFTTEFFVEAINLCSHPFLKLI